MSAGSCLRHEEYNVGDEEVRFLQIWIEPKLQNVAPRYQKRYFSKEKRKNKLQVIISSEEGTEHCWINQNAKLSQGWLGPGLRTASSFNGTNKYVYLFVLEGSIAIEGENIGKRDGIGVWETDSFEIKAEQESEFIVIETPINQ